jgi:hypothetical protein
VSRVDPSPAPPPQLKADAKNRAWRTTLQGLAIDVAVAVALVLVTLLAPVGGWGEIQWAVLGFTLFKTVLMAVAAFIMRRFVDKPGSIALPPTDPGLPSDTDNSLLPTQPEE